jgi:Protein of unknown function (DUF2878)
MTVLRIVVNVVAYQCAWFAGVLGAAAQRPWLGVAVAAAAVLWHLHSAVRPQRELRLILIAALCGAAFETLLVASGWVHMSPALLAGSFTPLWMVALWAAFATTLNVSLRALRPRYLLSALLGAVGAPLAYWSGARMGALQWVHELPALVVIALGWALLTPLLMKSAQRFDGFASA